MSQWPQLEMKVETFLVLEGLGVCCAIFVLDRTHNTRQIRFEFYRASVAAHRVNRGCILEF